MTGRRCVPTWCGEPWPNFHFLWRFDDAVHVVPCSVAETLRCSLTTHISIGSQYTLPRTLRCFRSPLGSLNHGATQLSQVGLT